MATTYRSLEIVPGETGYGRKYVWQAPVRLSHWINALSIAALFLTTEAVIADKPEKAAPMGGDPSGGMGGMDF